MNGHPLIRKAIAAIALAASLAACGSRHPPAPEAPPPSATADNAVVMPPIAYGKTATGLQLTKDDDRCDVPASLRQAVQDQLPFPLEHVLSQPLASADGAPVLTVEITDILANAGGLYGGPKIVQLHGTLERRGAPPAQFTAQRQMFIYFGMPRSTCSMVGVVTYALGGDIVKWMQAPIDGAKLGEL